VVDALLWAKDKTAPRLKVLGMLLANEDPARVRSLLCQSASFSLTPYSLFLRGRLQIGHC